MKRNARALGFARLAGRLGTAITIAVVTVLVGVQFERVIAANVAMASQLASVRSDIQTLQVRRAIQVRDLQRLRTPNGAIPEIHDRLRLVGPHEALIFIRPAKSASPSH